MQILACFTITTSKAGTKINCRRNGNEVKFESRRNGSRQNGSKQNGSRQNGSRRNGNIPNGHPWVRVVRFLCFFSSPKPKVGQRRPSSSTVFKHLLLRNHWTNESQISYGWGSESLFKWTRSHDQDGCPAHMW